MKDVRLFLMGVTLCQLYLGKLHKPWHCEPQLSQEVRTVLFLFVKNGGTDYVTSRLAVFLLLLVHLKNKISRLDIQLGVFMVSLSLFYFFFSNVVSSVHNELSWDFAFTFWHTSLSPCPLTRGTACAL